MNSPLKPGDRVIADGGLVGAVVCNIGAGLFSESFTAADWSYLQEGVMVRTEEAGLVHYPDENDLRIVGAKSL